MSDTTENFTSKVNEVVSKLVKDKDKNIYVLPDNIECTEEVKIAAMSEARYRNTQSAYTKTNQKLIKEKKVNEYLVSKLTKSTTLNLSEKEREDLEELKESDPDAWRHKLNSYESIASSTVKADVETEVAKILTDSTVEIEKENRQQLLNDFNNIYPDVILTDKVIENNIPPRIIKKLEQGDINFAEFLEQVKIYIVDDKKVANTKVGEKPDLSSIGSSTGVKTKPDVDSYETADI